jgi:hypothetical protein
MQRTLRWFVLYGRIAARRRFTYMRMFAKASRKTPQEMTITGG